MPNAHTSIDPALSAERIVQALLRPDKVSGVRLPTYPELVPTCTTQCSGTSDITISATAGAGVMAGLLTRSPIYPVWGTTYSNLLWSYQATWGTDSRMPNSLLDFGHISAESMDLTNTWAGPYSALAHMFGVGNYTPPWTPVNAKRPCAPLCTYGDDRKPYIFVPTGSTMIQAAWFASTIQGGSLTAQCTAVFEFLRRAGDNDEYVSVPWVVAGNCIYRKISPATSGWVRPKTVSFVGDGLSTPGGAIMMGVLITNSDAINVGVSSNVALAPTVTLGNTAPVKVQFTPLTLNTGIPTYDFVPSSFRQVVPTGVYLEMINTTKVGEREGSILGVILDDTDDDAWSYCESSSLFQLQNRIPPERRYKGPAEDGFFASVLPSRDFSKIRHLSNSLEGFEIPVPVMHRCPGDFYTAFVVYDASGSTPSGFAMKAYSSWEFIAANQFVKSAISGTALETMHKAMLLVNSRPIMGALTRGTTLALTGPRPQRQNPRPKPKPAARPRAAPQPFIGPKISRRQRRRLAAQAAARAKAKA